MNSIVTWADMRMNPVPNKEFKKKGKSSFQCCPVETNSTATWAHQRMEGTTPKVGTERNSPFNRYTLKAKSSEIIFKLIWAWYWYPVMGTQQCSLVPLNVAMVKWTGLRLEFTWRWQWCLCSPFNCYTVKTTITTLWLVLTWGWLWCSGSPFNC